MFQFAHQGSGRQLYQVTFGAAGAGATLDASSPVALSFPTGIVTGSFLIAHVIAIDVSAPAVTTPTGWFTLDSVAFGANTLSKLMWRPADGAESGSQNFAFTGSTGAIGRMYRASHGVGVEGVLGVADATADTTATAVDLTTLGPFRLACQAIFWTTNSTIGNITGESGADYTEAVAEFNTAASGSLSLQVAQVPAAAAITGGSATMGSSSGDVVHAFAIVP